MSNTAPKLHNAMWPGLVGKGDGEGQEPPISLERMLDLTAAANVNGQKFEGIDYFLFLPHTDPNASDDEIKSHYRALAKEHHSDVLAARGVPQEFLIAAEKRLAAINAAYDQILAERGRKAPRALEPSP